MTNEQICGYIVSRLRGERIRLKQTQLAAKAGIPLRTYVRFDAKGKAPIAALIAVLRALNRVRAVELLVPTPVARVAPSGRVAVAERIQQPSAQASIAGEGYGR